MSYVLCGEFQYWISPITTNFLFIYLYFAFSQPDENIEENTRFNDLVSKPVIFFRYYQIYDKHLYFKSIDFWKPELVVVFDQ